jgi:hypothetical protein
MHARVITAQAGGSHCRIGTFGAASAREEPTVVSPDIGDTELQRRSDPTGIRCRARARPDPQSARRPCRVLLVSSRRSSIVVESSRVVCTRK